MSTVAPVFGSSASLTVNSTSWTTGVTISTDALNVAGLSPIPTEIEITVAFTCPNSAPTGAKAVNVYVSESEDGTNYDEHDQYSGSNNSQTSLRSPSNFKPIGVIAVNQNIAAKRTFRVLGGQTPARGMGVILENQSGLTLTSPAVTYSPISVSIT